MQVATPSKRFLLFPLSQPRSTPIDNPVQHDGPITCLGSPLLASKGGFCVSGGVDGSVIFWRLGGGGGGADCDLDDAVWHPLFRLRMISANQPDPVPIVAVHHRRNELEHASANHHVVMIAFGDRLVICTFSDRMLSTMARKPNWTLGDLEEAKQSSNWSGHFDMKRYVLCHSHTHTRTRG